MSYAASQSRRRHPLHSASAPYGTAPATQLSDPAEVEIASPSLLSASRVPPGAPAPSNAPPLQLPKPRAGHHPVAGRRCCTAPRANLRAPRKAALVETATMARVWPSPTPGSNFRKTNTAAHAACRHKPSAAARKLENSCLYALLLPRIATRSGTSEAGRALTGPPGARRPAGYPSRGSPRLSE